MWFSNSQPWGQELHVPWTDPARWPCPAIFNKHFVQFFCYHLHCLLYNGLPLHCNYNVTAGLLHWWDDEQAFKCSTFTSSFSFTTFRCVFSSVMKGPNFCSIATPSRLVVMRTDKDFSLFSWAPTHAYTFPPVLVFLYFYTHYSFWITWTLTFPAAPTTA